MFIFTAKLNKKKLAIALAAALVVCGAVAVAALNTRQAAAAVVVSPKGVKTAGDRVAYLREWGWQVPDEAASVEELELPKEFGAEYGEYLKLQADQGFDLTKYTGKRVKRYTYEVLNYPTGEQGVTAHLLICKGTVIGGEVLGTDFLHGFQMPES